MAAQDEDELSDLDTLAGAVTFWMAARSLIDMNWGERPLPLSPIYTLLGFSIENGLKALLQSKLHEPLKSWKHSHDLRFLRLAAADYGLSLSGRASGTIDALSPYHSAHIFRYPKRIEGRFPSPNKTSDACEELFKAVGLLIGVNSRI